ncbi:nitroreductase family protein [Chloroflexota bacterium]
MFWRYSRKETTILTLSEAISQRRSIRSYKSDPVPDEIIQQMLEAARLAPSGSNRQPWRFMVITDAAEKARLRQICLEQSFIEQAPVVIVCCADLTAYSKAAREKRNQEYKEFGVTETLTGRFADPDYRAAQLAAPDPDLETMLPMAVANTYIAVEHMVLTATSLGLGTCWTGALGEKGEVEAFLGLPPTTRVVVLLPVGYPAKVPPLRPRLKMAEILLRPL